MHKGVIEEHRHGKELSISNWTTITSKAVRLADAVTAETPTPLESVEVSQFGEEKGKAAVVKVQGLLRARQGKLETRRKLANQINSQLEIGRAHV